LAEVITVTVNLNNTGKGYVSGDSPVRENIEKLTPKAVKLDSKTIPYRTGQWQTF